MNIDNANIFSNLLKLTSGDSQEVNQECSAIGKADEAESKLPIGPATSDRRRVGVVCTWIDLCCCQSAHIVR